MKAMHIKEWLDKDSRKYAEVLKASASTTKNPREFAFGSNGDSTSSALCSVLSSTQISDVGSDLTTRKLYDCLCSQKLMYIAMKRLIT